MKRIIPLGIVLSAIGTFTPSASAGIIDASAVITAKPDGSDFDYTIKLTNTSGLGNDSIATFWFAWVPGAGFPPDQSSLRHSPHRMDGQDHARWEYRWLRHPIRCVVVGQ